VRIRPEFPPFVNSCPGGRDYRYIGLTQICKTLLFDECSFVFAPSEYLNVDLSVYD